MTKPQDDREDDHQNDRAPILVVAHVNHDRIWQLEAPLVSGQRQNWLDREVRVGGGGWFTGTRLLALGWPVSLHSHLAQDARATQTHALLAQQGFALDHLDRSAEVTRLTEILLAPNGERTILAPPGAHTLFDFDGADLTPKAAYLNIRNAGPALRALLERIPMVLIQLPLSPQSRIPADMAVTSIADFPGLSLPQIWHQAASCCGNRLKTLFLTDGPEPVHILQDGHETAIVPVENPLPLKNSIGAGDSFAGYLLHALLLGAAPISAVQQANSLMHDWLLAGQKGA